MFVLSRSGLSRPGSAMLLSAATAFLFLLSSPSALGASENWYSRSEPLAAWEDGKRQALAYGTAYTKNGYLKNHTFYRDPRPGGDRVYTETSYSYYKSCNGVIQWCQEVGKDQSARDSSGDWVDQYDKDDYTRRGADRGRVHYKVCEDQAWSPDACSRKPYITFSGL